MTSSSRRAAARSIDGVWASAPVRVTCGPGRAREAFCAEDAEGSRKVQAPAVPKKYESMKRGPAEHDPEMITKGRKRSPPPLILPCPTVCGSRRRRGAMSKEGESAAEVTRRALVRQASTKLS
jgi:hypothetical protein